MKNGVRFLIVTFMLAVSVSAVAATSIQVSAMTEKDTLEALEGLKLRQHTGVITAVNANDESLVIKNRRGEYSFSMNSDTQVKKGREKLAQSELRPGIKVTVRYWKDGEKKMARIVKLQKD